MLDMDVKGILERHQKIIDFLTQCQFDTSKVRLVGSHEPIGSGAFCNEIQGVGTVALYFNPGGCDIHSIPDGLELSALIERVDSILLYRAHADLKEIDDLIKITDLLGSNYRLKELEQLQDIRTAKANFPELFKSWMILPRLQRRFIHFLIRQELTLGGVVNYFQEFGDHNFKEKSGFILIEEMMNMGLVWKTPKNTYRTFLSEMPYLTTVNLKELVQSVKNTLRAQLDKDEQEIITMDFSVKFTLKESIQLLTE